MLKFLISGDNFEPLHISGQADTAHSSSHFMSWARLVEILVIGSIDFVEVQEKSEWGSEIKSLEVF